MTDSTRTATERSVDDELAPAVAVDGPLSTVPDRARHSQEASREAVSAASRRVASAAGSTSAVVLVTVVVLGWLVVGVPWGFDEHWHLWAHTGAALITLFMVFVVQHTTNRESRAMLVKLDELLRVNDGARGELMAVEHADLRDQERVQHQAQAHPDSAANPE